MRSICGREGTGSERNQMPAQDTSHIKEKIISIIRTRGPSLPVHIAKGIDMSILFTSAFLSELLSERKIEISKIKVGSSPIYLLPEQKSQLEKFSHHLKSKEKEAFQLLKQNNFLNDREQEPAIRVALRAIKDFAIPFKKNDEIYWRYFTIPEKEFEEQNTQKINEKKPEIISQKESASESEHKSGEAVGDVVDKNNSTKESELNIFDKEEKKIIPKKKTKKQNIAKNKKPNQKLFNKVKEFLAEQQIKIIDFQSLSKDELILKIEENNHEKLLIAFNKKRISETDLIRIHKKIGEKNLPYIILSRGDPSKKFINLIETIKKIDKIKNIEPQTKTF